MNARTYSLNPESAKQANSSLRITDSGPYVGKFTRAEAVTSTQGTEGVEFTFESSDGQSADFLTLWTINKDGKEIFGLKMLNALMTCMKVKNIAPKSAKIEKFQNGGKVMVEAELFPDLMHRPIGLLLQREEYQKRDGSVGNKFNIYGCFEAATKLTASEILEQKTTPEQLQKIIATLRDKPMNASAPKTTTQSGASDFSDFSDDIPF